MASVDSPNGTRIPGKPATRDPPPPNFDRVARLYRWAEFLALGPLLTWTRTSLLSEVTHCRQALVLGDGDGRFAAALLRQVPALRLHAVDSSAVMLRLLLARCLRADAGDRLSTELASVVTKAAPFHIPTGTDLVVTHFLLDCLTQPQLEALAGRLASGVAPGCLWLVSEFGLPRPRLLRLAAGAYIRLLYLAFRVLTDLHAQKLPDSQTALCAAGFQRIARRDRLGGFLYSELWRLGPTVQVPTPRLNPGTAQLHPSSETSTSW